MGYKDKWSKPLKDKLEGFEMQEPDGLWDSIGQRLDNEAQTRRRFIPLWLTRVSAAASSVAAIALIAWLFTSETPDLTPPSQPTLGLHQDNDSNTPANTTVRTIDSALALNNSTPAPGNKMTYTTVSDTTDSRQTATTPSVERLDTGETPYCTTEEHQYTTTTRRDTTGYHEADQPSWHTSTNKPLTIKTKNSHQLALSVYTSGAFASNTKSSGQIDNFAPLRSMVTEDEILSNQPLVRSRSVNSIDTRNFDMRHHLPLRAGLKISYQILNNIAIESGVQYSRHTSDFSYDSNLISATGEQELHYIGIPLDINIGLARWKKIRAYATAGVSAEKLVKGNLKGQTTDRDGNTTTKQEQLSEKPLQWALNATAGLQYDLTDHLGLYAEPGVGYHPDNKSSLRNIYKDRPVDFTLTIGLRLTLRR